MSVFITGAGVIPPLWKRASDFAVGESVFLNVNGTSTEFLVVNQGIPSGSGLYDSSCDGTWLLMKDLHSKKIWQDTNNDYANSYIHAWLNGDFYSLFDSSTQDNIKQVKIPYRAGSGYSTTVTSGTNGLSTKVFLLGGYEVGWTQSTDSGFPIDGACLSYFSGTAEADPKRIAYLNGTATHWWLRSPYCNSAFGSEYAWIVYETGQPTHHSDCSTLLGIRPAMVLDSTALLKVVSA